MHDPPACLLLVASQVSPGPCWEVGADIKGSCSAVYGQAKSYQTHSSQVIQNIVLQRPGAEGREQGVVQPLGPFHSLHHNPETHTALR